MHSDNRGFGLTRFGLVRFDCTWIYYQSQIKPGWGLKAKQGCV